MTPDYPNDSDGDALRRVASEGNDMSAPMVIDFPVVIPTESSAKQFAEVASANGYKIKLWKDDTMNDWDVICTVKMVPTHADVVRIQEELTECAKQFNGYCDSWGTFGNKTNS